MIENIATRQGGNGTWLMVINTTSDVRYKVKTHTYRCNVQKLCRGHEHADTDACARASFTQIIPFNITRNVEPLIIQTLIVIITLKWSQPAGA
jgi:hypothetical protein